MVISNWENCGQYERTDHNPELKKFYLENARSSAKFEIGEMLSVDRRHEATLRQSSRTKSKVPTHSLLTLVREINTWQKRA